MQKKVLLPLLLAGPVALPAFADINFDFPNIQDWNSTGSSFNEGFKVEGSTTQVDAAVGTGTIISQVITGYPAGNYNLIFSAVSNINVAVNGEALEATKSGENTVYNFSLGKNQTIQIEVSPANASLPFSFTGLNLVLIFDVKKAQSDVSAILRKLDAYCPTITEVTIGDTGDYFKQGDELRAKRQELVDIYYVGAPSTKQMVVYENGEEISANDLYYLLQNNQNNPEKLAEIYSQYGYDQDPTYPVQYFTDLLEEAQKLNDEIIQENEYFANYQTNLGNYTDFKDKYDNLNASIAAQQAQLDASKGISEELLEQYKGELSGIQSQVETWWSEVNDAYKQPILENETLWREGIISMDDLNTSYEEVTEALDSLKEKIGAADANWKIYYEVNFVDLPNLKNAYNKLINYLETVEGVEGYENNFEDYVTSVREKADNWYNNAKDKNIPEIEGAVDYNEINECQSTIQDAIEKLTQQLEESTSLVTGQNEAMTEALESLNGYNEELNDITDNTTVPTAFKEEWQKLVEAAEEAIGNFKDYVEKEYGNLELDTEAAEYTSDVTAVEDALNALKQYAKDNNFEALTDIQDKLDDAWNEVPEDFKDQLQGEHDAIQDAIDSLDPKSDTLQDSIKDIEDQIQDMLDHAQTLQDLQDRLNDAWDEIEEEYDPWVKGKVEADRDNLQEAIDDLDPTKDDFDDLVKGIQDRIDQMTATAAEYQQVLKDINDALNAAGEAITEFNSLIGEKKIQSYEGYPDETFDSLKDYIKNYQESDDTGLSEAIAAKADYLSQLADAKDIPGQNCLDELKSLLAKIQADDTLTTDLSEAEVEFEKGGTNINSTTVEGVINDIDLSEYSDYAGYSDLETGLNDIKTELASVQAEMASATTVEDYQGIDDKFASLLGKVIELQTEIKKVVDNKTVYDSQTADLAKLSNWLEKLKEYNQNFSLTPAQEFFNDEIGDLETELDDLKSLIDQYYNELNSASEQSTLNDKISEFDQKVLDTYKWCKGNNDTYNGQLQKSTEVNAYISGLISTIENMLKDMEEGTVTELLNGWKNELQDLLTESTDPLNWADVNTLAFNYYGEGNSAKQDDEIIADYDALIAAAGEIDKQLNGDTYREAVKNANDDTTSGWGPTVDNMNNDYLEGIRDYNYFFYIPGLTNEGWKAYVEERGIESSHKVLFEYYEQINNLNTTVLTWIAEMNATNHVITSAEWQNYMDQAKAIEDAIEAQIESLISDMNSAAKEYYAILHGKVESSISEAEGILSAQGIPTSPYMDTIIGNDKQAEGMYDTALSQAEDASPMDQVGGKMDEIANILDTCLPPYDYQKWASAQWDKEYSDAQSTISDYRDDINNAEFADSDYRKEQMEKFEDIVDQIGELNDTVKGVTEGLIDDFGSYSDQLDDLLSQLEEIKDNIQKNSDNNVAEQDAYNDFQDAYNNQLIPGLDDLDKYAKSLAGAATETIGNEINGSLNAAPGTYEGIKGAIEALANCVETNKGNLLNLSPTVEERVDAILAGIEAEYGKVAAAETKYLMGTLYGQMVKEAFNNAYEYIESANEEPAVPAGYDSWEEYFNTMNEKINGYEKLLGEAGTWGGTYSYETRDNWREKSVEMEVALCEIYASLQNVWTSNPVDAVIADLDQQKAVIQSQLDAAKATLTGYENLSAEQKAKFSELYEEIQTALNDEAEAWENEGDWVIAREAFHHAHLILLGLQIEDVAGDVDEAETIAKEEADKKAQSDARFGELEAQYNDLLSQYEELENQIGGYSENIQGAYEGTLENIKDMLDEAYQALQEGYEAGTLTPDSQLQNADQIQSAIEQAKNGAALMNANEQLGKAKSARDEANQALRKHIVPTIYEELFKEYSDLNNELNQMLDDVMLPDNDYDSLTQIAERAKELEELFNQIVEQAKENTYYLGDVNDNPDGVVDVYDVQILINWVGEGMTYDELYAINPRQALAADVTGDREINIADVTTLIQWIISGQIEDINGMRVKARNDINDTSNVIEVQLVEEFNGVRNYAIHLKNETAFRGGQLDLITTGDARIKVITETERTVRHDVISYRHDDNTSRVVIVSLNNNEIQGNDGDVVYVTVEGKGDLMVDNVIFSDTNNRAHRLSKAETSGVDGFFDTLKDYGEKIYDAAGRMYNKVQRGINIIRHKDGSVTKEIRK